MAYSKNTWALGDVITPEKLNHIEDAIGGCAQTAVVQIGASGFSSGSRIWGYICYAFYNEQNDIWVVSEPNANWYEIGGYANDPNILAFPPFIIPADGSMFPFLILESGAVVSPEGNVNDSFETIFFNGSAITALRILGNCKLNFYNG